MSHTPKSTRSPFVAPPPIGTGTNFIPSEFTNGASFVAAAGVMAHYVGDASQPLHSSYLHHGRLPMEAGLTASAISFTKGCYVGQENTARMNWRQKVNRRLVVVPLARSDPARQRVAYPELGLAVDHRRVEVALEDPLRFGWNPEKVMLFDAKTGVNLRHKAA